jgi:general secretion pathway protein C
MDRLLRRYVWVIDLIGIGIGAALAGHATALLVSSALPRAARPAHRVHLASGPARATAGKSIDGIVGRNVFCSTCGDAPVAEPSRRPLRLLAIMFAPPPRDPCGSVAIVRDDEQETVGPYVVGARLGDATISAIEDVRVVLDVGGGRREYLELLAERPPRSPDAQGLAARAHAGGIRKIGAHSYEVRRDVVDGLGGVTPPWPRAVPELRDGQPVGFRLFSIRTGNPIAALGLQNGDLLLQANGRSLATPDGALAAYAALRSADHIWLLIERGGRPVRIDYWIR